MYYENFNFYLLNKTILSNKITLDNWIRFFGFLVLVLCGWRYHWPQYPVIETQGLEPTAQHSHAVNILSNGKKNTCSSIVWSDVEETWTDAPRVLPWSFVICTPVNFFQNAYCLLPNTFVFAHDRPLYIHFSRNFETGDEALAVSGHLGRWMTRKTKVKWRKDRGSPHGNKTTYWPSFAVLISKLEMLK